MDETPFKLLKLFPAADEEFVAFAEGALTGLGEAAGPEALQDRLRERYPAVRVQVQEPLGMNGAIRPHWYVFRDGRLIRST